MKADPDAILGAFAASHLPILVDVLDGLGDHRYEFMSAENFDVIAHQDWQEAQRVYWLEILYRAHFAAATSLIRTSRWIDAMLATTEDPNYTAFMAAYRGCLEAAADSYHTFRMIPGWLADFHTVIRTAIASKIEQPTLFKELEDELIHFTHAGYVGKGEKVDPAHRAKQTAEYLAALAEVGTPDITECYRTLCDVTHPGIGSVACYADTFATETGSGYRLKFDRDAEQITDFCKQHENVSRKMIIFSLVPPIMTLRILNDFDAKEIHTPGVMRKDVERAPFWGLLGERLKDKRPPTAKYIELPQEK